MGITKSKIPNENGFFLEGPKDFVYDEKKSVFEKKNGLLFRLKNTEAKQWAYYNDTKKFEFHVTVNFGTQTSNLVALGETALVENADGWSATVVVYPGVTMPFVQGDIVDFQSTVNAVLLTTEYKEMKKKEKKDAKKAEKEAKKAAEKGEEGAAANEEVQ